VSLPAQTSAAWTNPPSPEESIDLQSCVFELLSELAPAYESPPPSASDGAARSFSVECGEDGGNLGGDLACEEPFAAESLRELTSGLGMGVDTPQSGD
jgi:hypothetical protein